MPWMVVSLLFYLLIFWESYLSWLYIKEKAITPCFPTFLFVSKILENHTEIGFVLLACFTTSSRLDLRQWASFGVTKDNEI